MIASVIAYGDLYSPTTDTTKFSYNRLLPQIKKLKPTNGFFHKVTVVSAFITVLATGYTIYNSNNINGALYEIGQEVKLMEAEVKEKLGALEARVGGLKQRVDALESRLTSLEDKAGAIEKRVARLEIAFEDYMTTAKLEVERLQRRVQEIFPYHDRQEELILNGDLKS